MLDRTRDPTCFKYRRQLLQCGNYQNMFTRLPIVLIFNLSWVRPICYKSEPMKWAFYPQLRIQPQALHTSQIMTAKSANPNFRSRSTAQGQPQTSRLHEQSILMLVSWPVIDRVVMAASFMCRQGPSQRNWETKSVLVAQLQTHASRYVTGCDGHCRKFGRWLKSNDQLVLQPHRLNNAGFSCLS